MAITEILFGSGASNILFNLSGYFSSTVRDSSDVSDIERDLEGMCWDGTNVPYTGRGDDKLYLHSGKFDSSVQVKTSVAFGGITNLPQGISWDGNDTPVADGDDKLLLASGQFSATIKTSQDVSGITSDTEDISFDGTDTPWVDDGNNKLHRQSGQFSATIKDSQTTFFSPINEVGPEAISWDGTDTLFAGGGGDELYTISGSFDQVIKKSLVVTTIGLDPAGIDGNDIDLRLGEGGEPPAGANVVQKMHHYKQMSAQ